jgi:hypothetical protein
MDHKFLQSRGVPQTSLAILANSSNLASQLTTSISSPLVTQSMSLDLSFDLSDDDDDDPLFSDSSVDSSARHVDNDDDDDNNPSADETDPLFSDSESSAARRDDDDDNPSVDDDTRRSPPDATECVRVFARVRPMNNREVDGGEDVAWSIEAGEQSLVQRETTALLSQGGARSPAQRRGEKAQRHAKRAPHRFTFDRVFTTRCSNRSVFEHAAVPIIASTMQGRHGCIFSYGQTASGKTHTIHGARSEPGLVPLTVAAIFRHIERDGGRRQWLLRVSYMEVYCEQVVDLLSDSNASASSSSATTRLKLREHKWNGVFVEGLVEKVVTKASQVYALLARGERRRHVGRTTYNEASSRSHAIFRLVVESSPLSSPPVSSPATPSSQMHTRLSPSGATVTSSAASTSSSSCVRVSHLCIVDLAGSENATKAGGGGGGARVAESAFINRSLLTLGSIINKLSRNSGKGGHASPSHIPYRDSKLTRLLQSSLNGRARIAVIANVSPSGGNIEESLATLQFAKRCALIATAAPVNEPLDDDETLLRRYRREIDSLRRQLSALKLMSAEATTTTPAAPRMARPSPPSPRRENAALRAQIEYLRSLILTSSTQPRAPSPHSSALTWPPPSPSSRSSPSGASDAAAATGVQHRNDGASFKKVLFDTPIQAAAALSDINHDSNVSYKMLIATLETENARLVKTVEDQRSALEDWEIYYTTIQASKLRRGRDALDDDGEEDCAFERSLVEVTLDSGDVDSGGAENVRHTLSDEHVTPTSSSGGKHGGAPDVVDIAVRDTVHVPAVTKNLFAVS